MNLHEEQERVQKAVSNSLSHVQEDPWLTQRVLANAKGEEPVKRKISLALVLSIVGILAVMGTAYALFSSQVAEFFGQHWNQELGARLQNGKIAQIGESVTAGDVVITLDEIVYRDRGLYGVGTVRPINEQDVLFPMDTADMLYESQNEDFHLDDETPALKEYNAAMALVARAQSSGGKMLTVKSMPLKIGVDDGTMLMPGTIGFYDIANVDGSLTYSFEASDGFVVNEGTTYQIQMESVVEQIGENGLPVDGTLQRYEWTISCTPVFMSNPSESPDIATSNVTVLTDSGYELITSAEYQESGMMPVYQAIETDFTKDIDPEWFNATGIAAGAGTDFIEFNDHAILSAAPEALFYDEYHDSHQSESYSGAIVRIIWVRNWEGHRGEFNLEKTELTGISLEDAQGQAETLITQLGLDCNHYTCEYMLDMSLDRIQTMGAIYEKAIVDGELLTDDDWEPYDYSAIPASEEGFYLVYRPAQIDASDAEGRYGLQFFVNSRGIVFAHLRNQFNMGEPVEPQKKLISNDVEDMKAVFTDIFSLEVDDPLRFDLDSLDVRPITEFKDYHGVNVSIMAYLDRTRIPISIDIGFGDVIVPERVMMDFPVVLSDEIPRIYAYSLCSSAAEKFEAIVSLAYDNSRFKDYYDLYVLATTHDFNGDEIVEAVRETFENRHSSLNEIVAFEKGFADNPLRQTRWNAFVKKKKALLPITLQETIVMIQRFMLPVANAVLSNSMFEAIWSHEQQSWL